MLLDSSTVSVSALGASLEPRCDEVILDMSDSEEPKWHYLLLRSKEIKQFNALFTGRDKLMVREGDRLVNYTFKFKTFIYTVVGHRKRVESCKYTEEEYQERVASAEKTINDIDVTDSEDNTENDIDLIGGGYLFIYAPFDKLSKALNMIQPRKRLVIDFSTRKPAIIPNNQMKDFIFMYETMPWNVSFMQRPISDYAKAHQRIRITGGALKGAEGYIVRLHRDRSLVFSFGNITLAISGIHTFPFEPVL